MLGRQNTWGRIVLGDAGDTGSGAGSGEQPPGDAGAGDAGKGDDGAAKARREAIELRQRLKAAEEERDSLKNAQLSEKEKAEKRAEDADAAAKAAVARLQSTSLKAEVGLLTGKVGIRPDAAAAALKLIDTDAITFTDGEADPASVEKALHAAAKQYPFLAKTGRVDAGEGSNTTTTGKNDLGSRINAGLRRAAH